MRTEDSQSEARAPHGIFATTHWSVVLAAGQQGTSQSAAALERLCQTYWYPLYVYVRRRGYSVEDAQDLTQRFFVTVLQKRGLGMADPERGRFRTFLLKSLEHFLTDDWRRGQRIKRGGGTFQVPLDSVLAEARYAAELIDSTTPERAYETRWAMTLVEQVLQRIRQDYARAGKERLFAALQDFLWGADPTVSYAVLAKSLGLTEVALRAAVYRLREQYRERLRAEVAHTVGQTNEVDDELHYLIRIIGGGK